jgi:hypothetical protein
MTEKKVLEVNLVRLKERMMERMMMRMKERMMERMMGRMMMMSTLILKTWLFMKMILTKQ